MKEVNILNRKGNRITRSASSDIKAIGTVHSDPKTVFIVIRCLRDT
ncbi:MAG TPA: hypothetical protein VMW89_13020 [Desulfatiglandales bacterium]|nr:hypothetical protein [Desulfatiglandales bacterium]